MKKYQKCLLVGVLSAGTIVLSSSIFSTMGMMFGFEQVVLTGIAGIAGGIKLLAGA